MAPPHTAASQASDHRAPRLKGPVILSRVPFKARLTPPPHPPAFNCSDENMIKFYVRVQEEEAMKCLQLKEARIREKFRLKEEDLLEKLCQERDECKTLDGVSESLARMDIDRNSLEEEEESRPQQGCTAVLLRKHSKKRADTTPQDNGMELRSDIPPYEDQSSRPNVVMKYRKENEENYPPSSRGYRKDTRIVPRSTFPPPPTNRTKPNEGTKNAPPGSDTRYSLFTLEQDLATPANVGESFFKRPPLLPLRPTAENSPRLNPNISHFKSDFPSGRRSSTTHNPPKTPPNKIIGCSHSPGQQQRSSFFFSDKLDDSEKENLDELAVLRQQRQHLLFVPPATPTATTVTSKAKPNPYISSSSAPCSPTGRKRGRDNSSGDLGGRIATTRTPLTNTTSSRATRQIRGLDTPSIAIPQPFTINHDWQRHSPDVDMTMEFEPQVKRARLLSPPPRLESSKPLLLLRDSKGLFGPQSLVLR